MTNDNQLNLKVFNKPKQTKVPVQLSLAFSSGQLSQLNQLKLFNGDTEVSFSACCLAKWPGDSIKWLRVGFLIPDVIDSLVLKITTNVCNQVEPSDGGITTRFDAQSQSIRISHKNITEQTYSLSVHTPNLNHLFHCSAIPKETSGNFKLIGADQQTYNLHGSGHHVESFYCPHTGDCLESHIIIYGQFKSEQQQLGPMATLGITFFHDSPYIKTDITVHNPAAAQHLDSQWDLGDLNSFKIKALQLQIMGQADGIVKLYPNNSTAYFDASNGELSIQQYSSGGVHWQSPVHVDASNAVKLTTKGYQLTQSGITLAQGDRANPLLVFTKNNTEYSQLVLEEFWQRFPKKISIIENSVIIDLLPEVDGNKEELQGGEKLNNTLWLALSDPQASLTWVFDKPIASQESSYITTTQAIPLLACSDTKKQSIGLLINEGLDLQNGFLAKREKIDEFGWRHFGDLYADHETAGYTGVGLFVSHYNNQYDPIFGFIRQFLLDGNPQWFVLADDLANHVVNIDIYHTELDKPEYNGGLFWHTDHYLKAFTSSHRSYSKLQESDVYQDHAGGGGPGGQHCYTTGLTYHYFLTGNQSSKQAVLTLTKWITLVYEGTGTCLELLLAIKNRNVPGLKNHLIGQYPLDRGTGNYIIALLDSYELTNNDDYLRQAELVIKNTIHPNDDVSARELANIESCWFYIVLLQAVSRYLDVKRTLAIFDEEFYYARDALLSYAKWMVQHEYPYLEKSEILEFPNDTWAAQDLRKTHVFAAAWYYSPANEPEYLQKAEYFQNYVFQKLSSSPEKSYTRVLALLMQNSGTLDYYLQAEKLTLLNPLKQNWPLSPYMKTGFASGVLKQFFKRLANLSIQNEYRWFKKRLGK